MAKRIEFIMRDECRIYNSGNRKTVYVAEMEESFSAPPSQVKKVEFPLASEKIDHNEIPPSRQKSGSRKTVIQRKWKRALLLPLQN
uniref:Uncharacterized protein n=1 Tax=Megaselia scalaris TaxID=36166 RepID=T1GUX7_MEGSC